MFYRLSNNRIRYLFFTLYVLGFIFGLIGAWHQFPSMRKWWPESSSELASWLQAFGSVAAIAATGYITRWQFKKNKKFLEDQKASLQLDLCDICEEMCDAVSSIVNRKSKTFEIHRKFNIFMRNPVAYHLNPKNFESSNSDGDELEDSEVYTLERIYDMQETLRVLLTKDLPVSLMKSIFYLQKYTAQYKGLIIQYKNDEDFMEKMKNTKSKEFRFCRKLLTNINYQKESINNYRNILNN